MSDLVTYCRRLVPYVWLAFGFAWHVSAATSLAGLPQNTCVQYRAILIGVDGPNSGHKVSDDVELLASYFRQWLPAGDVEVLVNRRARHEVLFNTLQSVGNQGPEVCTVIYFAGDVANIDVANKDLDQQEKLSYLMAWLSSDRSYPTIGSKGISFAILKAWFAQSHTGPILLIVDNQVAGSQAGYFKYGEGLSTTTPRSPRYVLSTSNPRRITHTVDGQSRSILALGLIDGLFHQGADQNVDAQVDLHELSNYLMRVIPAMSGGDVHVSARMLQAGYPNMILTSPLVAPPPGSSINSHMAPYRADQTSFAAPTAQLAVTSNPPGKLYVDGELMGTTPQMALSVPAGEVTIEIEAGDFEVWQRNVYLEPQVNTQINAELDADYGQLSIANLPPDARVLLNDSLQIEPAALANNNAVRVPLGFYRANIQYGNGNVLPFDLSVKSSDRITYEFRPDVLDFRQSFLSVLFPGWGQRRDGAVGKANIIVGIMVAGGASIAASNFMYDSALDDYQTTFDAYVLEQIEIEALQLWDQTVEKFDRADRLYKFRNGAVIGMVAFYALNIVDAMIFHARHDQITMKEPAQPSFSARGHWDAAGPGMTFTFSW